MAGRPGRPRAENADEGLTSGEVAKQLNCSRSNVDRLRKCGQLPGRLDRSGAWRYQPTAVAEAGRKLGRPAQTDGKIAAKIYAYFLAPGFRGTPEQMGRIVLETEQPPKVVRELLEQFRMGAGTPSEEREEAREMDRLAREYDEQIAAMDEELALKRRGAFIPGDPRDAAQARGSRRTGT
jgi:hypothetical protein